MIHAKTWSDDHNVETELDATPYFEQASDAFLLVLAVCSFSRNYPADEVAMYAAKANPQVAKLFTYLVRLAGKKGVPSFEYEVYIGQVLNWLLDNRLHLKAQLLAITLAALFFTSTPACGSPQLMLDVRRAGVRGDFSR